MNAAAGTERFGRRLRRAVQEHGRVIAGVDPHASLLQAWSLPDTPEGRREFSRRTLDAVGDSVAALKCSTPQVDPSKKICNGIPGNEAGLLSHCAFPDFPFFTCVRFHLKNRPMCWC